MIIGNPFMFALESNITHAYENLSLRGLGYFVIYIKNIRYGIYSDNATALGCSLDNIKNRIAMKGKHLAPFAIEKKAEKIAHSIKSAIYADNPKTKTFFGYSISDFTNIIYSNKIIWAPDGDEAFDDGSYILHFDVDDKIRLIGFRWQNEYECNLETLSDIWLNANDFYNILKKWYDYFLIDWNTKVKKS